ncbi:hypothetical protein AVEN_167824-1 [Araneus ventricosus]|uniref:Uncharacterized protein n=1 Tax=Araneus ventricosus TaxID=182803 RepID=A0A4Y2X6M6_ARAVE|nr:hypothetical protein AVEN_167824-1 [Araneus ventricosus]
MLRSSMVLGILSKFYGTLVVNIQNVSAIIFDQLFEEQLDPNKLVSCFARCDIFSSKVQQNDVIDTTKVLLHLNSSKPYQILNVWSLHHKHGQHH